MELQELQSLLQELLQALQLVMNSGEEISDEVQGEIAKTLQILYSRIEQISGNAPTISQPTNLTQSMPSSNVEGFSYDPQSQKLFVRFLGQHPNRNGPIYSYDGVPSIIFDLFRKGAVPARTDGKNKWGKWWKGKFPSMGAALYSLIKTQSYPYQRVA